jgi:hypothetical protein
MTSISYPESHFCCPFSPWVSIAISHPPQFFLPPLFHQNLWQHLQAHLCAYADLSYTWIGFITSRNGGLVLGLNIFSFIPLFSHPCPPFIYTDNRLSQKSDMMAVVHLVRTLPDPGGVGHAPGEHLFLVCWQKIALVVVSCNKVIKMIIIIDYNLYKACYNTNETNDCWSATSISFAVQHM